MKDKYWPGIVKSGCQSLRKTSIVFLAMVFLSVTIIPSASGTTDFQEISGLPQVSSVESKCSMLDVDTFTLPPHLGEVRFSYKGNSDKIVIHVQDAHCNYFAQTRISDIIDYLNKEYGIHMLNVEGGAGDYDLSAFTNISGEEIRREVAEYFVKKGEVNGAELYAINNPEDVTLWGIEDKALYLKNLKVYRDSLSYKSEVDIYLKELRHIFNNLKRHMFSSELLKIDMAFNAYKAGNMDFKGYLNFLISTAKGQGLSVKKYPNLYLISQAMEKEASVDFKRANAERSIIVDKIKGILSKNEIGELVSKTVDFKTKRISVKDFYNYLLRKVRECGIKTNDYPALTGYIVYISLFEAVDSFYVMEELDQLEADLKDPLYRKDSERTLNLLSRNLALMGNIFELLLTKNDFAYYRKNEETFLIRNFLSFIEQEAPVYGIKARPSRDIGNLDGYLDDISEFYKISFERDVTFIRNMRFSDTPLGKESALIMTGGFHTENLSELFRNEGYSYVSIMPKFTSEETYDNPYFAILAGQTADIQQMLRSALAGSEMLQVASFLNSDPALADAFYGEEESDIFEAAVGVIAYLREVKGYSLSDIEINRIVLDEAGLGLKVTVSEGVKGEVTLTVPWKIAGRVGFEELNVERMALDAATKNSASKGAMTEKYFVHKCMKDLEEGKTLMVLTGETSGLSDLNDRWGHMGVDIVRDAFGEKMYEVLNERKSRLASMGVAFSGHNNPYGGRWHFAFEVDEGKFNRDRFGKEIESIYLDAKNRLSDDSRIIDLDDDIKATLQSLNVVFGVSEPMSTARVMGRMEKLEDDNKERHQSLIDSYSKYRGVSPLTKEAFGEMGEVYKYTVRVLYGDSLRGTIYAENVYYSDKAPQLLSRLLRKGLKGGVANHNVFTKGGLLDGVKRVFFSTDKVGEGTIRDWYKEKRRSTGKGWGKYDVFRFKIPNFTLIEEALNDLEGEPVSRRRASEIIFDRLFFSAPDIEDLEQLTDYTMGLAVLDNRGIPQGRNLINTLMKKYSEPDEGFMFRVNLDFDNLSLAPEDYGDIVNSVGVERIERAFSTALGMAVTVRAGTGDEMVVVGYSNLGEKDLNEAIQKIVDMINGKIDSAGEVSLLALKDATGKEIFSTVEGEESGWKPSISAGVTKIDLRTK